MNKGPLLLLLDCLAAAHPGLADDKNASADAATAPKTENCIQTATYAGELPCADCAGIETLLTLNRDGLAVLTSHYLTDDPNLFIERGTWSMKDKLLAVAFGDDTRYFNPLPDGAIMMVSKDGEASDALADAYTLKPVTPLDAASFAGQYALKDDNGDAQTLAITAEGNDMARVEVKSRDCEFQGAGRVVNDVIELPFKTGGPDQAAVMIIRPTQNKGELALFTSDYDERYALNYFCRGGGTLAGEYALKKTVAQ